MRYSCVNKYIIYVFNNFPIFGLPVKDALIHLFGKH